VSGRGCESLRHRRAIALAAGPEGVRNRGLARSRCDLDALLRRAARAGTRDPADVAPREAPARGGLGWLCELGSLYVCCRRGRKSFRPHRLELDDADLAISLDANLWRVALFARSRCRLSRCARWLDSRCCHLNSGPRAGARRSNQHRQGRVKSLLARRLPSTYARTLSASTRRSRARSFFRGGGWDRRRTADPTHRRVRRARDPRWAGSATPTRSPRSVASSLRPKTNKQRKERARCESRPPSFPSTAASRGF